MKKILTIPSIKCNACAEKISGALFSFPEVEEVTVDVDNKTVTLELNTEISNNELKNILKGTVNYEVTEIK